MNYSKICLVNGTTCDSVTGSSVSLNRFQGFCPDDGHAYARRQGWPSQESNYWQESLKQHEKFILVLICTHLLPWLVMPAAAQDQADRLAAQVEAFTKLEPHTEVVSGVDPSVLDPFIGVFKGTFQDFEIAKNGDKYHLLQDSKFTKPEQILHLPT